MRETKGGFFRGALASALLGSVFLGVLALPGEAEERQRRNIFGMHNLKDGGPDLEEGLEWTRHLVGGGFVFDWVTDIPPWIDAAFRLGLVPCIRVQEGRGGAVPSAAYAGEVADVIMRYKIAHPEFADRLVYLQLWNEPNDPRDFVRPDVYADYLVAAHHAVHQSEARAAAAHPELPLSGTLKTMTPGQNGPSWWDLAFTHNPDAKLAFDVWGTHPYPEAAPPHYNHHDGDVFIETTKTIDSYLMDLDVVARPHGNPPRSRRGFPVMITETAYGNKLGISYEGWPKTSRPMAAAYNVDAFSHRWYRWPEILAVHPYLLANIGWESFAWVPASSCNASPKPGCSSLPRCSEECDGDGIREPKGPHLQYTAVRDLRLSLETQGMAPARTSPYRGATGSIRGRTLSADTGAPVPYATVRGDGYAVGHVSLFDGGYEVHDVPIGTYTLTAEKNGFRSAAKEVTVVAGQTTTADFSLVHTGRVSRGIYFVDSPPQPGCPGCQLFDRTLGQTFTVPSDVGFIKYAAAKPYIDGVILKFSILDGGPGGPQVGQSLTATLEPGDGAIMIGGEWPDGQEPAVQPGRTYFLKIERADGQGIYCYASNANPYPGGNAWVGGQSLSGVDFVAVIRGLTPAVNAAFGGIAGFVREATGAPIAAATVSTAPGGHSATTDASGRYSLAGVPVGTYQASASRSGYSTDTVTGVEVLESQTTALDFTLDPGTPTGSIGGTVRDTAGRPLSGAEVATTVGGHHTTADASGAYVLSGLEPGSYAVRASKAGHTGQTQGGVSVTAGATTTLQFVLPPVIASPPAIVNPNFEDDGGFFGVARGWTKFGSNKWEAVWDRDRVFTQGVSEISPATGVGVYQTIDVTPDATYRVTVHTKVTADGYGGAIGVDPAGGTSAGSATYGAASTSTSWSAVTVSFQAAAARATIFLKGHRTTSLIGWVQFDGVTIEVTGGSGNQPPTVSLGTDQTTASAPGSFVLTASASDPDGSVSRVEFLQGGTLLNTDTTSPYSFTWSGVPAGGYSLAARAHDDAGASAVSNTVTVTVTGSTPSPTKSKLTVHAGWGGHSDSFVRNARPRVVKLFDEVKNAALVKQLSPGTLVVGRLFPGSVPDGVINNGSPADRARDWWNTVKGVVLTYPAVDYWEGLNEPVVTNPQSMTWYAQFEIARVDLLAENGRRACIGNFATGNPDLALWPQFIPAIDHARARGGIMGLHEYGTPMTQFWDAQAQEGWLVGRYRKVYRQHLQGREIPLVITEAGVDEGTLAANGAGLPRPRPIDAQANHGWQQALGTPPVPGFPAPGDLAARKPWYLDQLKWYDGLLKQDAYVLGATIYQLEIPGWASFDVRPLVPELTDHVAPGGAGPPLGPSDPGLVWLSDGMDTHDGSLVKKWSKWWSGAGAVEWNIVPGEGGGWAQEVKKTNVDVGISRPNRGFKAGDAYRLRFRARKTTGAGSPRCYAGVQPSGGVVSWGAPVSVTSTTSWVDVAYDFIASNRTTTLLLRADLTGLLDVGVAFDRVSLELVSPRDPEPWMISGAPPVEPLDIQGIHDSGAEDLFVQASRQGWVTEALAIGSDPSDQSGHRFAEWIDGIGVIGRIAHLFGQILPDPGPAPGFPGLDAFAQRAANFVKNSVGCGLWSIGNEPHLERVPDPAVYAEAFVRAYRAIKAVRPAARVITAGFVHGDLGYFRAALEGIESRGVIPDGIALHTYTDSQGWNEVSFRDYRTKIANLPASMRSLPIYITEAGTGGPGNPTTNSGLINTMFGHVRDWNASGGQRVHSVCFYRWTAGTDQWAIEGNPGLRADFEESLRHEYR